MTRCPTCNALRPEGAPCPGCLVGLGLRAPQPEASERRVASALVLGLALGLSVSLTGLGAMFTWIGPAGAASESAESLGYERMALEDERQALELERQRLTEAREQLAEERERLERAALMADRGPPAVPTVPSPPAVDQAALRADEAREQAARAAEQAARAEAAREAALEASLGARRRSAIDLGTSCEDLAALETPALLGKLSVRERACLVEARDQTHDEAISRLLMVDAFSARDMDAWRGHAEVHLNRVAPDDADVAYKLALERSTAGDPASALKWSEVALANRTTWTGKTYTDRVYSVYKLRFASRLALDGLDDPMTRGAADEWREFAVVAGRKLPKELEAL